MPLPTPVAGGLSRRTASPPDRNRQGVRLLVRLLARARQCDEAAILAMTRGSVEVARTRQLAMYLANTALSLDYTEVGRLFGRDRTTVAHACRLVEDLRDDPMEDHAIGEIEAILECLVPLLAHAGGPR